MSSTQFIDVVNRSTNNVEGRVPVLSGTYSVHSGILNEHDKVPKHNRSGVFGIPKQATSSNEADLSTSSKRKDNIFAPRIKLEVKDLAQRQTSEAKKVFDKRKPTTQPCGYTNAPELFHRSEHSPSPVDDWKLGNNLGTLFKSNPNLLFTNAKDISTSTKSKRTVASIPGILKYKTKPSPSSTTVPDRHTHHSPESRQTPTPSTTTDRSSPAFTDPESSVFSLDEQSVHSAATTPPLSPTIPTNVGRARSAYTPPMSPVVFPTSVRADTLPDPSSTHAQSKDTPPCSGMSAELSLELFGEEPAKPPKQVAASSLFDADVTVAPKAPAARVVKGPSLFLPRKPQQKKAYNNNKIPITRPPRTKVEPAFVGAVAKQTSVGRGHLETDSGPSRGTKRVASPVRPVAARPSKQTSATLCSTRSRGRGRSTWVLKLLKDLTANIDVIPAQWVRKDVLIREYTSPKGMYQHKNKHQLLKDVVDGYASCDEEGTVAKQARTLLIKWGGLTNGSA
ncbi:hypothetical protein B0H16DRAFT_1498799 [Mycena metata]|uniref:Uncharacterized protein n=1 Tax=Mycena metata TaxID=1033252 RepID=A0AAD7KA72_9AGAR|nr:hypothetical protein B0H16DRAFT_1498799 [Mycena metata]